jgi:two-component system, OmpR family, response regulator
MEILLIEDDAETASFISQCLSEDSHRVVIASDGRTGLNYALGSNWDLLIVDRMLPHLDGLSVVRELRDRLLVTPVLFLTTLGGVDDRVEGLNAGADDYLTKPFAFAELLARVAALGRRSPRLAAETTMSIADLEIDLLSRTAKRGGAVIELLPREFRLLEYLMRHREQIVTRTMLLENVWDVHFEPNTTVVETHISRLRSKVDRGHSLPLIHTLRGAGYSLRVAV